MQAQPEKKRHRFKMPSAFTILFIIIIIIAVLSWFIPAGKYSTDSSGNLIANTYHTVKSNPQGLWNVVMSPVYGMVGDKNTDGAISVSLFILVIGGFLGVVNKTKALDAGISSIVNRYKGREKVLIPILMTLFALGGSTYGMAEETVAFYPLLIPVMMACGFDSIVAVALALVGTSVGNMASTVNPFATGVASQTLGISPGDGLVSRIIFFVIVDVIAIAFVMRYATKIQKDPTKSYVYAQRKEDWKSFNIDERTNDVEPMTGRQKAVIWLFMAAFVIMIIGLVPWSSLNKHFTFFDTATTWLENIPVLGTLLGHDIAPLGTWYFSEITMLFLVMSVVVMWVYHMKEDVFIDAFMGGMADFVSVAMIVAVARGLQVVMNNGLITATILHAGETGLTHVSQSLFIILTFLFYVPMSFLIPSTSGLAAATMGIMGPLGHFAHVSGSLVITAYQAAEGWVGLVTPTSGVVMAALAISHVNLTTWWKWSLRLMLYLFIATVVFLAILAAI